MILKVRGYTKLFGKDEIHRTFLEEIDEEELLSILYDYLSEGNSSQEHLYKLELED